MFFKKILAKYGDENILTEISHVVGVQPDHPDRTTSLDNLLEYAVENSMTICLQSILRELEMEQLELTKKDFSAIWNNE